ncbi:hypothetical protein WJX81_006164 [Elliptochloris bilobata]|uniref:Uncharacterized protein n=1 Tax=Elliptochloris bilobata TaxID=381761 RepID=A0AAW1RCI1_9CHLO
MHKQAGMVNVKHRMCARPGCHTRPAFNFIGEAKGQYCNKHKELGMINVDREEGRIEAAAKRARTANEHNGDAAHGAEPTRLMAHLTYGLVDGAGQPLGAHGQVPHFTAEQLAVLAAAAGYVLPVSDGAAASGAGEADAGPSSSAAAAAMPPPPPRAPLTLPDPDQMLALAISGTGMAASGAVVAPAGSLGHAMHAHLLKFFHAIKGGPADGGAAQRDEPLRVGVQRLG